jgi:hypothetical protein
MRYILMTIILILTACGEPITKGDDYWKAHQCNTTQGATSATVTCPDGSHATVSNGTAGSNGVTPIIPPQQVVTTVKFCPQTPSYPNTFVEYGICLNNQVWGVYSANGGFLALLPPGAYSSDGINSSCNFTILANCVVKN